MKTSKKQFDDVRKTFSQKSLSDNQKDTMLSYIYSEGSVSSGPVVSPLSSYFIFFKQKAFVVVSAFVLLFSGTSYASAHSLPGDFLYPIKTGVMEPIGLALKFTEESKNNYQVSLLKRRIDELEVLRQQGEVTENSKQDSSKAAEKTVRDLEKSTTVEVGSGRDYISDKVKIYNNLTDPELEIKTHIEINTEVDVNTEIDTDLREKIEDLELNVGKKDDEVIKIETGVNAEVGDNIDVDIPDDIPSNTEAEIEVKIPEL